MDAKLANQLADLLDGMADALLQREKAATGTRVSLVKVASEDVAGIAVLAVRHGLVTPEDQLEFAQAIQEPSELAKFARSALLTLSRPNGSGRGSQGFSSQPVESEERIDPFRRVMARKSSR